MHRFVSWQTSQTSDLLIVSNAGPMRSLHPSQKRRVFFRRWRAWWMRKSWSWSSARFLSSQNDGIVVFQRSLSNPSPDHSVGGWRILWSDMKWLYQLRIWGVRSQNRTFFHGAKILYRVLGAFRSKAKFTIDVADPALCMTDSTSVIYLFLHVVWTQRLKWKCLQTWRLWLSSHPSI